MTNPCQGHAAESARAEHMKEAERLMRQYTTAVLEQNYEAIALYHFALLAHIQRGAVPEPEQIAQWAAGWRCFDESDGLTGEAAMLDRIAQAVHRAMLAAAPAPDQFRDVAGVVIRTCSDERPCIPCYTDSGACLGPAPARTKAGRDAERRGRFLVECDDVALRVGPEHLGLCDAIDNDGQPYQSQALADEIAALRGEAK